jgi:plastocyanin
MIATSAGASRFNGTIINGVASITYQVPASPAGTYRLGCIVHPAMTGTLTLD